MAEYWDFHARNSLEEYVALAQLAKDEGLPVKIGLEVDYYAIRWTTCPRCSPSTPSTC